MEHTFMKDTVEFKIRQTLGRIIYNIAISHPLDDKECLFDKKAKELMERQLHPHLVSTLCMYGTADTEVVSFIIKIRDYAWENAPFLLSSSIPLTAVAIINGLDVCDVNH